MEKGKIIYLNGVSSSGKSTLAKTLQERLTEPYYWINVDTFCYMMPEKHYVNYTGPVWKRISSGMHNTIRLFSDMGMNVIADDVFESYEAMEECVGTLHEYPVLFVHVTCPPEELRRRERERGDRGIGQAEDQLPRLSPQDNVYDITVDTFNGSKEDCADRIIKMMDYPEKFKAFETLWSRRSN